MGVVRRLTKTVRCGLVSLRAGPDRPTLRLAGWLLGSSASLCLVLAGAGLIRRGNAVRYFGDFRWGTGLSAGLLLLASIGAFRNWRALRGVFVSVAWLALGVGLAAATLDDALGLHERVDLMINDALGWDAAGDGDFIDDAIIPLYGVVVGGCIVVCGARCFAKQPALVWCWGAAGVFFAVMVALDFTDRFQAVEETCKILAGSLIYAGTRAVRHDPLHRRLRRRAAEGRGGSRVTDRVV
ncbi:MAG: hypothetical protein IT439_03660 [Phycisphaerales bacterium]|nr:hypothetical protein [Phycisphaerales bacterium]